MLPSLLVQGDLEGLGPWFGRLRFEMLHHPTWAVGTTTGFLSEIGTKLRDWAVGQAGGSCYSRAALSSNDLKTL